jgi:sugar phosphate isomerase/epimerase
MMKNLISVVDYDGDWALKEGFQHPRSLPGYLSREELVAFYGTLGVDALEFSHCYWEDCSAASLKNLAANCGLPIVCYLFEVDLTLPSTDRRHSRDVAFSLLDRTAELGAPLAMIVPAFVKEGVPLRVQRRWLIEGLRDCAAHAEAIGVTLVVENFDDLPARPFLSWGSDCREICAEVNSPAFRLIYDSGAPQFIGENPLDTLIEMAPFLVHVHLKNNRQVKPGEHVGRSLESESGRQYTGTVLDGGEVDLGPILAELNRMQYDGYLLIEYQGEEDPRTALQHNVEYLRSLIKENTTG